MGILKDKGVVYRAAGEMDLGPNSNEFYIRAYVKAPRVAGFLVKVFVWLLESRLLGGILLYILKKDNLIHKLVSLADYQESPLFTPACAYEEVKEEEVEYVDPDLSPPDQIQKAVECLKILENKHLHSEYSFFRWTILDYSRTYNSKKLTPTMVAKWFIEAVRDSSEPGLKMSFFIDYNVEDILKQATESTIRYERGEPLSSLDGVPVAIKDEIDCMPYATTGGTKWLPKVRSCKKDAFCVKKLRLCGAVIVGKTNMHELGAGTSGINPHYGAARNPYNHNKIAGGSSSGSAAVVSAGLCPIALGVDGGGSVRLPAALCGVVGFKPTFGCISHSGVLPLNWTVGMVGILAGTVEDAFLAYAAIRGQPSSDKPMAVESRKAKVHFPLLKTSNCISNIKMAKYGEWFDDCTDEIKVCCYQALEKLHKNYGWETVQVTVPEIEAMRLAHYVTMGSECCNSIARYMEKIDMAESGWDARVALSIYGAFNSSDYLSAQKMRNRQMQFYMKIFAEADVIVTPTTGVTAYTIYDDALKTGELDYINAAALARFSISGNFLGLPAVTVPVGYDKMGLPIGLQFIGRPWSEATLIQIAYAMQALCISDSRKPKVFYDLLRKV